MATPCACTESFARGNLCCMDVLTYMPEYVFVCKTFLLRVESFTCAWDVADAMLWIVEISLVGCWEIFQKYYVKITLNILFRE